MLKNAMGASRHSYSHGQGWLSSSHCHSCCLWAPPGFWPMTYAVMDDVQATFHWLEKSYDRHEVEMTWLKMEPLLN